MAELQFLRYVTIGQYLPLDSPIHRLDARSKLLAYALLVVAVTFNNTYIANAILLLTIGLIVMIARVPIGYALQGIRPALPALVILAILRLLLPPQVAGLAGDCRVIWRWPLGAGGLATRLVLTDCTLRLVIVSAVRLSVLIVLTSLLTFSTTTAELAHGTEALLAPLQFVGFPAHELALVVTIALRFVPTLALQMERIVKAQIARGADFGTSSRLAIIKTVRRLLPLLVPLFLVSLHRSEALILAMEARGYTGGKGRTRRVKLHVRLADYVAITGVLVFCITMLCIDFAALDRALVAWLLGS
jgi:energy-coupling factor transport system permease protein